MPPPRRIAVLLDPERIDLRWHHTLRGIARHAQAERRWHVTVDPFADRPGHGPYHGLIAPARRGRARSLTHSPVPVVCVTWGLLRQRLARGVENRYAAARLAARHLADRGCRSFAYLGFTLNPQSSIERHHFRLELRKRGLRIHRARTFVSYGKSRRRWERIMAHLGP